MLKNVSWLLLMASMSWAGASGAAEPAAATVPACHNGSYRTDSADLLVISGPTEEKLRYFLPDGRTGFLKKGDSGQAQLVPGWVSGPAAGRATLGPCDASAIEFSLDGQPTKQWSRLPLHITETQFDSNGIQLKGRLVAPPGERWPLVILVHGAETTGVINVYSWQYLLPAQGIGVFVFDKRGTGGSAGTYTQNFDLLAQDVAAAVGEARKLAGDRAERVGLLAGSQGGWVGPLAATKTNVDFMVVAFGMLTPVLAEDKLQVVNDLRRAGYDEDTQRKAGEVADATAQILRSGFKSGYERLAELKKKYGREPWFAKLTGEYTGEMVKISERELRRTGKDKYDNLQIDWNDQPLDTMRALQIPQLWMLAEEDIEAPNAETIALLHQFQDQGRQIDVAIFPHADHGLVEFDETPDLQRTPRKYATGFFDMPADWVHGRMLGRQYGQARIRLHSLP